MIWFNNKNVYLKALVRAMRNEAYEEGWNNCLVLTIFHGRHPTLSLDKNDKVREEEAENEQLKKEEKNSEMNGRGGGARGVAIMVLIVVIHTIQNSIEKVWGWLPYSWCTSCSSV